MLEGLGPDCDGALFVGYHAMAGTQGAVLEHTWNYKVYGARVGGLEVGEFGVAALLAGESGVPALYLSGDDKAAAEARALVPGITTTVVKTGVRREAAALCVPGRGARAHQGGRRGGAPGRGQAGAARLERRAAPAHLHPRAVLRPRRDLPGRDAARRAHAGDRRRHVRGGLPGLPRLPAALGVPGLGRASRRSGRSLRLRRCYGQIVPSSGCGAAGSTSASQAEDRGFESRHPLQSFLLGCASATLPCASVRRSSETRVGKPLD